MKNVHKQSSLFILELIISITFFVLSTLVCVQIFVKSHEISNQTKDVTIAMNYCTGVLEEFENDPTLYQNKKEYLKYYTHPGRDGTGYRTNRNAQDPARTQRVHQRKDRRHHARQPRRCASSGQGGKPEDL